MNPDCYKYLYESTYPRLKLFSRATDSNCSMDSRINFNETPPAPPPPPNTTTNSGDSVSSNVESFTFNFANLRIATSSSSPALNQTQQIHHTNGTPPPTLNTNSGDSVSSNVRSLPFNYANLRIATSSSSTSSPALNQTQQIHHTNANYETGLQHIPLSSFALYPQRQSIWSSPDDWLGGIDMRLYLCLYMYACVYLYQFGYIYVAPGFSLKNLNYYTKFHKRTHILTKKKLRHKYISNRCIIISLSMRVTS